MKNRKLEDILAEKLHEARQEPPQDMWTRISASLEQLQQDEAHSPRQEARPLVVRRPRRMRFGVAIAASLALCAVLIGIRTFPDQQQGLVSRNDQPQGDSVRETYEEPKSQPIIESQPTQPEAATFIRRRALGAVTGRPVMDGVIAVADNIERATTPGKEVSRTEPDIIDTTGTTTGDNATAGIDPSERQDNRQVLDWDALVADNRYQRTSPLRFSLYTGDLGTGSQTTEQAARNSSLGIITPGEPILIETAPKVTQEEKLKHRMPVTVGFNFGVGIWGKLSFDTGLSYTYLYSENKKTEVQSINIEQKLHYLGIPVALRYDFLEDNKWGVYASAGAMAEVCVSALSKKTVESSNGVSAPVYSRLGAKGLQMSVNASAGAEFRFIPSMGLYVEPGVSYYFKNRNQPDSYRTDHPWNFSLRAGLRFHL